MTIKKGEKGQPFYIAADFDLSGFTALSIKFEKPDGTEFTVNDGSASPVTAPATPLVNDPAFSPTRSVAASEYFKYVTTGDEFDVAGDNWKACALYTDATRILEANEVTFTIGESCL
jgi:hypothetical protein